MSDYIPFSNLIKKWDLQEFEILKFIKDGLQPYSKNGVPIHCPEYAHACTRKEISIESLQRIKRILGGIDAVEKEFGKKRSKTLKNKETKDQIVEKQLANLLKPTNEDHHWLKIFRVAEYLANKKCAKGSRNFILLDDLSRRKNYRVYRIAGDKCQVVIDKRKCQEVITVKNPYRAPTQPDSPNIVPILFIYADDLEMLKRDKDTITERISQLQDEWIEIKKNDPNRHNWANFDLPLTDLLMEETLLTLKESFFKTDDVKKFGQKKYNLKKLRPSQKHEKACRKVAETLWQSNPKLTIPQIANKNEIVGACDGKEYKEKTIRKWIKDLNPNSSPGRRKGT